MPVAGTSHNCGETRVASVPPATTTVPLDSNVAVWRLRAPPRLAVALQALVVGSYNSALVRELVPSVPPATKTVPLGSNVAVSE
jgi:hypothetical protein